MLNLPVIKVPAYILRDVFNKSELVRLTGTGELSALVRRDAIVRHPERIGEVAGTRSQLVRYIDADGELLVEVHQYLRPDGSLGASGLPDPKRMRVGDEIWVAMD
ncbi:MAG: hypothetical protein WD645_04395 [Dehalococcoidia bacterium]